MSISAFGIDHGDISKGFLNSYLDASARGVGGVFGGAKSAAKAAKKSKEVDGVNRANMMVRAAQQRKAGFPQGPPKSKFASGAGPTGPPRPKF